MRKEFNVKIISYIKKLSTSKSRNVLQTIATFLLYPLLLMGGLLMLLVTGIFSAFQKIFSTAHKQVHVKQEGQINEWVVLTEKNVLKVFKKYKGEIRFGPVYVNLKTEPPIKLIKEQVFGDWFYQYHAYIFLQEWNSTFYPNTNLVCIETATLDVKVLQKNIPAVIWSIVEKESMELQLSCNTGKDILTYSIRIDDIT